MLNPMNFKGSFIDLYLGHPATDFDYRFEEKKVIENGIDIRG